MTKSTADLAIARMGNLLARPPGLRLDASEQGMALRVFL
jgi:hypothetical protein